VVTALVTHETNEDWSLHVFWQLFDPANGLIKMMDKTGWRAMNRTSFHLGPTVVSSWAARIETASASRAILMRRAAIRTGVTCLPSSSPRLIG